MSRYRIVPERSRIDVTARPALPGLRLLIDEVSGTIDTGASADVPVPVGALTLWLQAVVDDDTRAIGVPGWLGGGELVAAAGRLVELRCDEGDRLEVRTEFRLGERLVPFTGAGRYAGGGTADEEIEVVGITLVDPRVLGFGLPPLVTYSLHTRWRLVLVPAP